MPPEDTSRPPGSDLGRSSSRPGNRRCGSTLPGRRTPSRRRRAGTRPAVSTHISGKNSGQHNVALSFFICFSVFDCMVALTHVSDRPSATTEFRGIVLLSLGMKITQCRYVSRAKERRKVRKQSGEQVKYVGRKKISKGGKKLVLVEPGQSTPPPSA